MSEKNLKITIRKPDDDSSSLSSSTENAIWEDLQVNTASTKVLASVQHFQSGSPSSFSMGGEYSPITTTPPPVRSLADLRNMFSTLSFAAPCADWRVSEICSAVHYYHGFFLLNLVFIAVNSYRG